MRLRYVAGMTAIGTAAAAYPLVVRRRQLGWGATQEESHGSLPGDDVIATADLSATRGITICASADEVWPWIAQLGQGRGGFYSYDFFENLVGCDIHSANRVVPEWQDVAVGDELKLYPNGPLDVVGVEVGRSLVIRGGVAMGNTPPPYDFTWAFVLQKKSERDGAAACAGAIRIYAQVGAAAGRARCGDQLRDDPKDAARHTRQGRASRSPIAREPGCATGKRATLVNLRVAFRSDLARGTPDGLARTGVGLSFTSRRSSEHRAGGRIRGWGSGTGVLEPPAASPEVSCISQGRRETVSARRQP